MNISSNRKVVFRGNQQELNQHLCRIRNRVLEKSIEDPKASRTLAGIDLCLIKELIFDHVGRSGIDTTMANFCGPDEIKFVRLIRGRPDAVGSYESDANFVLVNPSLIEQDCPERYEDCFLRIIIHEELHAASQTMVEIDCYGDRAYFQNGYYISQRLTNKPVSTEKRAREIFECLKRGSGGQSKGKFDCYSDPLSGYFISQGCAYEPASFSMFDEGVTEKLAREIHFEYLRRSGGSRSGGEGIDYYSKALRLAEMFIGKLANEIGIGEQTIWQAIICGKFSGCDLNDEELKSSLAAFLDWNAFRLAKGGFEYPAALFLSPGSLQE